MKIGVPKEIKAQEARVALTPGGVLDFIKKGHIVYVQTNAGLGSGFSDSAYIDAGAEILPDIGSSFLIKFAQSKIIWSPTPTKTKRKIGLMYSPKMKSVAQNSGIQIFSKLLSTVLGLIALAIMTRALGAEKFGWYITAAAFMQFVGIFIDFGSFRRRQVYYYSRA